MQGAKEVFTILWAMYNSSEIKASCKNFQPNLKRLSLRSWDTHSETDRYPPPAVKIRKFLQPKIISDVNGECFFSLYSSHGVGDAPPSELFPAGGWNNQETILRYLNPSLSITEGSALRHLGTPSHLLTQMLFTFTAAHVNQGIFPEINISRDSWWGWVSCRVGDKNHAGVTDGK